VNGECKYKSSIKKKTLNPIWDESAIMGLPRAAEVLEVVCMQHCIQTYGGNSINVSNPKPCA
jgi:Ca2+-dependent lipid-binding protein